MDRRTRAKRAMRAGRQAGAPASAPGAGAPRAEALNSEALGAAAVATGDVDRELGAADRAGVGPIEAAAGGRPAAGVAGPRASAPEAVRPTVGLGTPLPPPDGRPAGGPPEACVERRSVDGGGGGACRPEYERTTGGSAALARRELERIAVAVNFARSCWVSMGPAATTAS
ncbi:MAG: hypothetical protein JWO57_2563 [Pseudonocardiales bacterium]|nr:hypothetical protein [Pseudonocardiales bacterium]